MLGLLCWAALQIPNSPAGRLVNNSDELDLREDMLELAKTGRIGRGANKSLRNQNPQAFVCNRSHVLVLKNDFQHRIEQIRQKSHFDYHAHRHQSVVHETFLFFVIIWFTFCRLLYQLLAVSHSEYICAKSRRWFSLHYKIALLTKQSQLTIFTIFLHSDENYNTWHQNQGIIYTFTTVRDRHINREFMFAWQFPWRGGGQLQESAGHWNGQFSVSQAVKRR